MKIKSLLGPKEIPHEGTSFFTDDNDEVDVPAELGSSLLEQVDAWAAVSTPKPAKAEKES